LHDLVVIGGGFWGQATARMAQENGLDVVLLDNGNRESGSRNAAGLIKLEWYKNPANVVGRMMRQGGWSVTDVAEGFDWLSQRLALKPTGEQFSTWERRTPQFRKGLWLAVDPVEMLTWVAPVECTVLKIEPGTGGMLVVTDHEDYTAKHVVVAAGYWTDTLLELSGLPKVGVKGSRGRAWVGLSATPLEVPLTRLVRPYVSYTLRPWLGGTVRLGDTNEHTLEDRDRSDRDCKALMVEWGVQQQYEPSSGIRPVLDRFLVGTVRDHVIVATGGHRVGLALAPVAAKKAMQLMGVVK
jgi:glycine/D-amino acid oxidase-like deaminating enzyme